MMPRWNIRDEVYDRYWYFAAERQEILVRRINGEKWPWTADPILQDYKFCNAYRVLDRGSQFMIQRVIYEEAYALSEEDMLFRIVLYRLMNRPETWERLESAAGRVALKEFSAKLYAEVLEDVQRSGSPIYGNGYILCANKAFGFDRKHLNHLALLELMFRDAALVRRIVAAKAMREVYEALLEFPLMGPFMAYQLSVDINYSGLTHFSESEFTVPGPGAIRGLRKCFPDIRAEEYAQAIAWVAERQEAEFEKRGIEFKSLGGRPLQYIDCQGLFCEIDKYARAAFPGLASNRIRIKARFRPKGSPLIFCFPVEWAVSDRFWEGGARD